MADTQEREALTTEEDARHKPFKAMAQGKTDFTVEAFCIKAHEYGAMLTLTCSDGAIYITKQQAMDFFGLVEASPAQPAAPQPGYTPASPEAARAVDDALGIVQLPLIRVDVATHAELQAAAEASGMVLQAVVRERRGAHAPQAPAAPQEDAAVAWQVRRLLPDDSPDYRAGLGQWTYCSKDEYELWRSESGLAVRALCVAAHPTAPTAAPQAAPTKQQEVYTYASKQATNCAGCGKHKHTPLRIDAMGGYVCLTCIDQKLGTLLGEFGYPEPAQQEAAAYRATDQVLDLLVASGNITSEKAFQCRDIWCSYFADAPPPPEPAASASVAGLSQPTVQGAGNA